MRPRAVIVSKVTLQQTTQVPWNCEEINGDDLAHVILQEGLPGLRRWPLHGLQEARYGSFGNLDAELLQFAMNPGRSPQGIGLRQGWDQSANLRVDRGSAYGSDPVGKLRPVAAETFALPAHQRVWMNDEQGTPPVLPYRDKVIQNQRSRPINRGRFWLRR